MSSDWLFKHILINAHCIVCVCAWVLRLQLVSVNVNESVHICMYVPIVLFVCHHCNVWTYNVFYSCWHVHVFLFLSSRTKYSPFSLEQLLSACNVFSSSVASNARGRLCRLGEDLVQPVIQVWSRSSQTLKVSKMEGGREGWMGGREGGKEG